MKIIVIVLSLTTLMLGVSQSLQEKIHDQEKAEHVKDRDRIDALEKQSKVFESQIATLHKEALQQSENSLGMARNINDLANIDMMMATNIMWLRNNRN